MLTVKNKDLKGQWRLRNREYAIIKQSIVDLDKGTYWQGFIISKEKDRIHKKLHIWNEEGRSTLDREFDLIEVRRGPEQSWNIS